MKEGSPITVVNQIGNEVTFFDSPTGSRLSTEIPVKSPTMTPDEFLSKESTSPHIHRYLALTRMAQDETRTDQRRELLKTTALDMLDNKTKIDGISFMPPDEHVLFMADLATHGRLSLQEIQGKEKSS